MSGAESEADRMLSTPEKEKREAMAKEDNDQGVHMKKELGLTEGVAIILGIIIGSGEVFVINLLLN